MRWFVIALAMLLLGGWLGRRWGEVDAPDRVDRLGLLGEQSEITPASIADALNVEISKTRPELELVDGSRYDFGMMKRFNTDSHVFRVRNKGTGELTLTMGSSSCSCTIGDLQDTKLAPGDSTEVKLTWTATALEQQFTQLATIYSNDPSHTEVRFVITGLVADSLFVVPPEWTIGESSSSEAKQIRATVYSFDPRPLEISKGGWLDEGTEKFSSFTATRREVDPQKDENYLKATAVYEFEIDLQPGLPQGPFHKTFRANYTLGDEAATLDMVTVGRITGDVIFAGSPNYDAKRNVLALVEGDKGVVEAKIFLRVSGATREVGALRVVSVVPSHSLEAELGEPRKGDRADIYPLTVRVRADAPAGTRRAGLNENDFGGVVLGVGSESDPQEAARLPLTFAVP
jgi:hypothetical protein